MKLIDRLTPMMDVKIGTEEGTCYIFHDMSDKFLSDEKYKKYLNREIVDERMSIDPEFPNTVIFIIEGNEKGKIWFRGDKCALRSTNSIANPYYVTTASIRNALKKQETYMNWSGNSIPEKRRAEIHDKKEALLVCADLGYDVELAKEKVLKASSPRRLGMVMEDLRRGS